MLCVKVQNGEEIRRIRLEEKSLRFETLQERSFGQTSVFEYVGDGERFAVTSQADFERALALANASGKTSKLHAASVPDVNYQSLYGERFAVTSQADFERALALAKASGKTLKLLLTNVHSGGANAKHRRMPQKRRALSTVSVASSTQSAPAVVSAPAIASAPAVVSAPAVPSAPAAVSDPAVASAPAMTSPPELGSTPAAIPAIAVVSRPPAKPTAGSSLGNEVSWDLSPSSSDADASASVPKDVSDAPSTLPTTGNSIPQLDIQQSAPSSLPDDLFLYNFPPSPPSEPPIAQEDSQPPPEKPNPSDSDKLTWACSRCTYENSVALLQCEVCTALRPDLLEELAAQADASSNAEVHPDSLEVSPEQERAHGKEEEKKEDDSISPKSREGPNKFKKDQNPKKDDNVRKHARGNSSGGSADGNGEAVSYNPALDIVKTFAPLGRLVTKVGRSIFQPIRHAAEQPPAASGDRPAQKEAAGTGTGLRADRPSSASSKRSRSRSPSPLPKDAPIGEVMTISPLYFECGRCGERIKGVRYQCLFCEDFHLCAECDALDEHEPLHSFVRIRDDRQDPFLGVLARMGISPFVGVQQKPSVDDAKAEADDGDAKADDDEVKEEADVDHSKSEADVDDKAEADEVNQPPQQNSDAKAVMPAAAADPEDVKVEPEKVVAAAAAVVAAKEPVVEAETKVFSARQVESPRAEDQQSDINKNSNVPPSPFSRNVEKAIGGAFPPSPPLSPAPGRTHSDDEVKEEEVLTAVPCFAANSEAQVVWRIENDGDDPWPHGAMVERVSAEEVVDAELLTQLAQSGLIPAEVAELPAGALARPSGSALARALDKVLSVLPLEVQLDVGNTREKMRKRAEESALPRGPDLICVPSLQPGEQIEIRVTLQTPDRPGHYTTHWQMTAPSSSADSAEQKSAGYTRFGECMVVPMRVKSVYTEQQEGMLAKLADMGYSDRASNIAAFVASDWHLGKVLGQFLQQEN